MRLIFVEWLDSVSHCDQPWHSRKELQDTTPMVCKTAGFELFFDDNQITVCLSQSEEEVGMAITIPRCSILSVTELAPVHTQLHAVQGGTHEGVAG